MRINYFQRMEREALRRKLRSSSSSSTTKDHPYSNGSKHHEEEVAGTPPPSSPDGKKDEPTLEERVENLESELQDLRCRYNDLEKSHKELQVDVGNLRRRDEPKEQEQDKSSNDDDEYTVENILQKRTRNGVTEYQIKWEGWEEMTWESKENLNGCREMVDEFEKQLKRGKDHAGTGKRKTGNAPPKMNKKKRMSKRY